ncbi:MAG TPA: DUF5995 family protein [Gemmatimonadota bacterium]|nr:DUF5995 family protein [Gemmatimonadota bacterium]
MPATTIDEVIVQLEDVVDWSRTRRSRLGYFAALYRKVTIAVKDGIADGAFEHGPRMEQLDVVFANRYLNAVDIYRRGQKPTRSWQVAFDASKSRQLIVLQHLLLGMNAHINLDLGIAAARVAPGPQIAGLKNDFNRINDILASLVDDVRVGLASIWPALKLLDRIAGASDDAVINFSIGRARDAAWRTASTLAPLSGEDQATRIDELDQFVAAFADVVRRPGPTLGAATRLIRLGERGGVRGIIDMLI